MLLGYFVKTILLLGYVFYAYAALPELDGYNGQSLKGCNGHSFLGEINVATLEECKALCDSFAQCEGFETGATVKCGPKTDCDETQYHGWNHIYVRDSGKGGCTFEEYPGFALQGNNDVTYADANPQSCKKRCLLDVKCLSFDLDNEGGNCSISHSSKDTQPASFTEQPGLVYYHKKCGPEVEAVPDDVINAIDISLIEVKDGKCTKVAGPYGPEVGHDKFNEADLARGKNITMIKMALSYGTYLARLGLRYGRRKAKYHGRYQRKPETIKIYLESNEYITRVDGLTETRLHQIQFTTNLRTIGPFGSFLGHDEKPFTADGRGKRLLYISGSSDHGVAHLNFHFEC